MPEISQARPRQRPSRLRNRWACSTASSCSLMAASISAMSRSRAARNASGAEQTREGVAKPRLQRARGVQTAMQECRQLGGGLGMPVTEEPAGQDRLTQRPRSPGLPARSVRAQSRRGLLSSLRQPWCRRSRPVTAGASQVDSALRTSEVCSPPSADSWSALPSAARAAGRQRRCRSPACLESPSPRPSLHATGTWPSCRGRRRRWD